MLNGLLALFQHGPVWIGPVAAFLAFILVGAAFSAMLATASPEFGKVFGPFLQLMALTAGLTVLAVWAVALIKKGDRRRLVDSRTGPASLREMSWQEFELLVGEAYRRKGYAVEETGGGGADSGIDLILRKGDETTLVQCKQWKTYKVGVKIVRELFAVIAAEKAHRGIIATCGRYTRDAVAFAEGKPLELLDGPALWRLVEQVKKDRSATAPPAQAANAPDADVAKTKPKCPKCNSPLVLRTARKGPRAGSKFYGCSTYPKCGFIRDGSSTART